MSDETKKCPACAEEIKAAATVCRFCNYDFATEKIPTVGKEKESTTKKRVGSTVGDGVRIGCGMFIMLPLLILIGLALLGGLFSGCVHATP